MKKFTKEAELFLANWLNESTCHRHKHEIFWQSENGEFVIMKHNGHSEYIDRCRGTDRCGTFYALYNLISGIKYDYFGRPYLKKWEGRWSKKNWKDVSLFLKRS